MSFQKAKKSQAKLRLAISGVSGGGKTFTALTVAKGLGGKVALIDTEHASAAKYADVFDFDTMLLTDHTARGYISAIEEAENSGYDVVIIDSLTHAWEKAKVLAQENEKRTHNSFNAWNGVTQEYLKIQNKIVASKIHVIGTYRARTEYAQEKGDNGKTSIKKLGLGIEAGKNQDFEFDIMLNMEEGGTAIVSKTRYSPWNGKVFSKPGVEMGNELAAWLSDGVAPAIEAPLTTMTDVYSSISAINLRKSNDLNELKAEWALVMKLHTAGTVDAQSYSDLATIKDARKAELSK